MRLRVRDKDGVRTLALADSATFAELVARYAEDKKRHFSPGSLEVKAGYPPKEVTLKPTQALSVCLRDGDQIIVAERCSPPAGFTLPSVPATPSQTDQPLSCAPTASRVGDDVDAVELPEGLLVRREMPDDNSCLFASVAYVLAGNAVPLPVLRELAVSIIQSDPDTYSEAVLGHPVAVYCEKLLNPNSWGGAIELKAFSDYFQTEICSADIQTTRVDRFGEGKYDKRAFVLYSGIHYDAIALTRELGMPQEADQTVFNADDITLAGAVELARKLQKKRQFTDLSAFTLRCDVCMVGLKGQKEAQTHAQTTGHANFVEYR